MTNMDTVSKRSQTEQKYVYFGTVYAVMVNHVKI